MQSASGGNHGSRSWFVRVRLWRGLRPSVAYGQVTVRQLSLVLMQSLMGETTAVAHGLKLP
ncbi:hypothetical protein [Moorena producens]|uniref:hypothetical protein n=1 Tax=Moorena producens TaxID=1155739 RepID=UPI001314F66F|nr:hypothetical protein [Moorena producens]